MHDTSRVAKVQSCVRNFVFKTQVFVNYYLGKLRCKMTANADDLKPRSFAKSARGKEREEREEERERGGKMSNSSDED